MSDSGRFGAVTFKGEPLTVHGQPVEIGQQAPDFVLVGNNLSTVSLKQFDGKVKLISVVPSLDTGICDAQTRRFNEAAADLGENVVVLTVSTDLPFSQKRWCGAAGIDRVITLSDHKDMNFGNAYGTHIDELRIHQRAIFVVDGQGVVQYVEYVPEIALHPDYESALAAVKSAV